MRTGAGCQKAPIFFTHTGSFALNAGIAGAAQVLGIDASQLAVEQAEENARLNGLENVVQFRCEDVFDLLPRLEAEDDIFYAVFHNFHFCVKRFAEKAFFRLHALLSAPQKGCGYFFLPPDFWRGGFSARLCG